MRACVVLAATACGGSSSSTSAPPAPAPVAQAWTCDRVAFAESTPLAEASGAAWWDGALLVISDSGNRGAFAIVDAETGETREQGTLPLGDTSDDFEGIDARGGVLYGLVSSGFVYEWRRAGARFELVRAPYAIGDGDLVCDAKKFNCGKDYEGLCLVPRGSPHADARCTGFAASRKDGVLYCVIDAGGRLAIDRAHTIAVTERKQLADCAFDDRGGLWAGGNVFALDEVYRVERWCEPEHAEVAAIGAVGVGNSEVIAVRGDLVYRMSDTNTAPSLMAKFRCTRATK